MALIATEPALLEDLPSAPRPWRLEPNSDPAPRFRHESRPVLSVRDRWSYWGLALIWLAANASFWPWWLSLIPHSTLWLYWPQTVALAYLVTALPSFYWFFVRKMRRPVEPPAPDGMSVAMITLCVPAHESLEVIAGQLEALAAVEYPHDSWVLDEGGSAEVRDLVARAGLRYFTRHGVGRWNRSRPPFQAKTKAGNVNAWLDYIHRQGIAYDVFVQLDIDHRPRPDYLHRVLGYFRDRRIAWVQAPSVCGNLDNWAARGLAEQDMIFQGPLQMGFYGHSNAPFIIGSHTSYRTSAIRRIGGFQPTRAEDHLDTVLLAAHGYRGVFVPELIAVGSGPHDFATYVRQQFAWAYSMIQILFHWTPRLIREYTPAQTFQFLMAQTWYTLWSLSLAVLWVLPALALFSAHSIADVHLGQYLIRFLPIPLTSGLLWCWTRRWFQPHDVGLSWRGVVLEIARWPVVLWALVNVVFRVTRPYMITPKGKSGQRGPSGVSLYCPYAVLAAVSLSAVWAFRVVGVGHGSIQGYYLLALCNAALSLVVVGTTLALEVRDLVGDHGAATGLRRRVGVVFSFAALSGVLVLTVMHVWAPMARVLL